MKFSLARMVQEQVEKAADCIGIPDHIREILKCPMLLLKVTFPVRMDDGRTI